jgi:hypothetical protein
MATTARSATAPRLAYIFDAAPSSSSGSGAVTGGAGRPRAAAPAPFPCGGDDGPAFAAGMEEGEPVRGAAARELDDGGLLDRPAARVELGETVSRPSRGVLQ